MKRKSADSIHGIAGLVERIPAGVYQADENGVVTYCNQFAARILGYESADDLIGVNLKSLYVDQEDRAKLLAALSKDGASVNYRVDIKKKSGDVVTISVNSHHRTPGTPKDGIEGVFTDVTDLASYEKLVEDLPVGVYQLDDKLNVIKCNHGFERVFGYERGELMGEPAAKLYRNLKDYERLSKDLNRQRKEGRLEPKITSRVIEMKRKNNDEVWISLSTHLRLDRRKRIVGREGTVTEITLRDAEEQKLISGNCFVALPFGPRFKKIFEEVISPTAESCGYKPRNGTDEIGGNRSIRNKVLDMVRDATIVIGDISMNNRNVMYELGLAGAFGKQLIVISQNEEVPSTLGDLEIIRYGDSGLGHKELRVQLKRAIVAAQRELAK